MRSRRTPRPAANLFSTSRSRREFVRDGLLGLGAGLALPAVFARTSLALASEAHAGAQDARGAHPERTLVVVELSGGNDGLNTVVPYRDDAYYRARPNIAVPRDQVLRLDDEVGLHPVMAGLRNVWERGDLAIVEGCGYENPSRSHFTSMEYWHTAVPHRAESYGWLGRFADARWREPVPTPIVNLAQRQSLAVAARSHAALVFSDPRALERVAPADQASTWEQVLEPRGGERTALRFLRDIARSARDNSGRVREAIARYDTPVSYGSESEAASLAIDLKRIAALIAAGFPTRIYYAAIGGFDTHSGQAQLQRTPLMYTADALEGFLADLERIDRANDVAVLVFTEFGRRVAENRSGGTDHGAAGPMYVLGRKVQGGLYGTRPGLDKLDANGDLQMTVDFRRVYASLIADWLDYGDAGAVLKGEFESLPLFS